MSVIQSIKNEVSYAWSFNKKLLQKKDKSRILNSSSDLYLGCELTLLLMGYIHVEPSDVLASWYLFTQCRNNVLKFRFFLLHLFTNLGGNDFQRKQVLMVLLGILRSTAHLAIMRMNFKLGSFILR